MKNFTAEWYDRLLYLCVDLLLGAKLLGDEAMYNRYTKLYDYLIERKNR